MGDISSDRLEPAAGIPTAQPQSPRSEGAKRNPRRPRRPAETPEKSAESEAPPESIPHKVDSLA